MLSFLKWLLWIFPGVFGTFYDPYKFNIHRHVKRVMLGKEESRRVQCVHVYTDNILVKDCKKALRKQKSGIKKDIKKLNKILRSSQNNRLDHLKGSRLLARRTFEYLSRYDAQWSTNGQDIQPFSIVNKSLAEEIRRKSFKWIVVSVYPGICTNHLVGHVNSNSSAETDTTCGQEDEEWGEDCQSRKIFLNFQEKGALCVECECLRENLTKKAIKKYMKVNLKGIPLALDKNKGGS